MKACLPEEWLEQSAELFDGQCANMLRVQPHSFGIEGIILCEINDGVRTIDPLERESGGKLLQSEELAVVLRRPPQQAEEVDESLCQEACIAVGSHADDGAVAALGELGAIGRDQQRKMSELWRLDAEGLEDEQGVEGVGGGVLAADDVADAQVCVIGARGEGGGGHTV